MIKKKLELKPSKAIFHAFLKGQAKGGAELLMFQLRDYLEADFWVGSMDFDGWDKEKFPNDPFVQKFWNTKTSFKYLHRETHIPIWRHLKRQLFFLFSPKIKELAKFEVVIFQGNVSFVQRRLRKIAPEVKQMLYVNTPPRGFADQFEEKLKKFPKIIHPIAKILQQLVISNYKKDAQAVDYIIANSQNIKGRLEKYFQIKADSVIYPCLDTSKFKFIKQGDFYLSYARLEEEKRIKMMVEAFKKMPDKKLVICSSGPLKEWLENEIKTHNLKNIIYEGRVGDKRLIELVGSCIAGIFIPKDEDAGMTQIEIMAAGKPIIGVKDGGLLETVVDAENGILLSKNPNIDELIEAVQKMTPKKALEYKEKCELQASKFSKEKFLEAVSQVVLTITENKN
jgi:glycosyltransferase involved in cell wall biosynthesis